MKPRLRRKVSRDGSVQKSSTGWRLAIPRGDNRSYRLAQLDDHAGLPRSAYPWGPPATLSLRARISERMPPGTWGFGFWNDPYGFSCGPGDTFLRLPALPRAAWFFGSSPKNYLSFDDDKPAHGFLAQIFSSPRINGSLVPAALALPMAPRASRRLIRQIIHEDSATVDLDLRQWHDYRLDWRVNGSEFWVDELLVMRSVLSPTPPLGLVIWVDNQYAAFDPSGRIRWGVEANPHEVWMEIASLDIARGEGLADNQ